MREKKIKFLKYPFFIILILVVGCTNQLNYNDDDIAAIVNGEEITIGELRFLYADEQVLDMIEGTVKFRLVEQEAKRMNLDVTDEINQEIEGRQDLPPKNAEDAIAKSTREFAVRQAEKFGMKPEVYYRKYVAVTAEQGSYVNAYLEKKLGVPEEREDKIKAYTSKANDLLDDLVEENKDKIKIRIKKKPTE